MTAGNRLTDMEFDEVSLVNRPANQLSKVVLFKSDEEPEDMTDDMEKGMKTKKRHADDDEEMVSKPGYGPNRMKRMDEEVSKPGHYGKDDDMDDDEKMAMLRAKKKGMQKGKGYMKKDDDAVVDLPSEVYDYIESLESANAEMVDELEKVAEWAFEDEDIMKSADPAIVEIVKAAEARAEAAEQIAKAERDFRMEREFVAKAAELDNLAIDPEAFGRVLKAAADVLDEDVFDAISAVLEGANELVNQGGLFEEVGKSSAFDNEGPMGQIEKAAARLIESDPEMTKAQAIAKAVEVDPSLYNSYLRGN